MVNYTYLEHWIPQQTESEKAMLAEFEAGNFTLQNPLVKYNPYLINPLAAVVLFKTEKATPPKAKQGQWDWSDPNPGL